MKPFVTVCFAKFFPFSTPFSQTPIKRSSFSLTFQGLASRSVEPDDREPAIVFVGPATTGVTVAFSLFDTDWFSIGMSEI